MSEIAKNAGDAAYAAKNWAEAIKQYTICIEAGGDSEFLKKIYSNRSAVYAAQKTYSSALLDADKCIQLDSEWAKGYARKGDALFGLRRWTDSQNAYNRAEAYAPGQGYKAKADKAIEVRVNEEERARQYTEQYSQGGSAIGSVRPTIPSSGLLAQIYNSAEKGLFALYFAYALPLQWIPIVGGMLPSSRMLYLLALGCAIAIQAIQIFCSAGRPRFSQDYLVQVLQLQGVQCAFLSVILMPTKPYLLAAAPLVLNQLVTCLPSLVGYLRPQLAQARSSLSGPMARYTAQLEQVERLLNAPEGVQVMRTSFSNMACTAEVMQGVYLFFELLLPSRNMILLYLWWQYLMMRYLMDQTNGMKTAFDTLDSQASLLCSHRMCPALVGKVYGWIKAFMIKQVEQNKSQAEARAQGTGGGFMDSVKSAAGKCTIS